MDEKFITKQSEPPIGQQYVDQIMIDHGMPENLNKISDKVLEYLNSGTGYNQVFNIIKEIYGV